MNFLLEINSESTERLQIGKSAAQSFRSLSSYFVIAIFPYNNKIFIIKIIIDKIISIIFKSEDGSCWRLGGSRHTFKIARYNKTANTHYFLSHSFV